LIIMGDTNLSDHNWGYSNKQDQHRITMQHKEKLFFLKHVMFYCT